MPALRQLEFDWLRNSYTFPFLYYYYHRSITDVRLEHANLPATLQRAKRKEKMTHKKQHTIAKRTCLDWGRFIGKFCIYFEFELDPETFQWNTLIQTDPCFSSFGYNLMGLYCTLYCTYPAAKLFLVTARMTDIWNWGFSIKPCLRRLVNPDIWQPNYTHCSHLVYDNLKGCGSPIFLAAYEGSVSPDEKEPWAFAMSSGSSSIG